MAQDEVTKSLQEQAAQLEIDRIALSSLEQKVASGIPYEEAYAQSMTKASVAAKEQAVSTKGAAGSTDTFISKQRSAQASLKATATASQTASVAMRALSMAANMFVIGLITKGIELAGTAISNYIHRVEKANEKIEESRSNYDDAKSSIESINDELKTTQDKINDLQSKGVLSFTDKAELDNLKEQNDELEQNIALQEKKKQNAASQTVNDIKQNKDTLGDDFDDTIKNLSDIKRQYEDIKQEGIKGMSEGTVSLENYEATMTQWDKIIDKNENNVLENIEKFEKYKEDIINKYETDDVSEFSQSDRSLYEDIISRLQKAYKAIYSDSEYNRYVIEPIFDTDKLKGLQDKLLQYFVNGGDTDLSSLENKFGTDIITALRNACEKVGIDFDQMIQDMYDNSQSKLDQIAPIIKTPNSGYEAEQNMISNQIRNYIQNDLSDEDRTILLNAEIPDDVKFKTTKDVDNFIKSIQKSVSGEIDDSDNKFAKQLDSASKDVEAKTKKAKESYKNYKKEIRKAKKDGLEENEFDKTKFGNIDLSQDRKLKWNSSNLKKYGNNIATWYDKNAQKKYKTVNDFVNSYFGKVSTVDARSTEFDGVEIAFTPMLKTKDGMEYLDSDTVNTYINKLIQKASEDDGKWTNEELFALDSEGLEVNGKKIKNIIADIGKTAENTAKQMHYLGKDGSLSLSYSPYEKDANNLESSLKKFQKLKKDNFKGIWDSLTKGLDEDSAKSIETEKDELLKLAEAGKLTEKEFKDSSINESFKQMSYSSEEATKYLNDLIDSTKQISSMKTGISSITSAYDEKKDANDKRVGSDTLSSMYDTLGVSEWAKPDLEVWEKYKNVASDSKSTLKDLKSAQDDLATSFVNSSNFLSNITDESYNYYVGLLKEMGVTNAETVATRALNEAKINAKIATVNLSVATDSEIVSLGNYISALDSSNKALAYYTIQKMIANNNALDSSKSIENLKALAEQCGITAEAISLMSSMAANMKQVEKYTTGSGKNDQHAGDYISNANSEIGSQKKKLNKIITKGVKTKTAKVETSKGNPDSKDKKNKDKSKSTQVIDWIERRLNQLQSTIDYTSAKLQNLFTIKAKTNNIGEQIKETTKLIKAEGTAAEKYRKKASSIKLSSNLKKAVREGRLNGYSMKQLIATYGEKTANRIQTYQDYYDKYQSAKQAKKEKIAARRQLRIDRKQVYVDDAEAWYNVNEARKENAKTASGKNSFLNKEVKNLKESYKYQKQIAKIQYGKNSEEAKAELARLEAEEQKKLLDIEIEKHQNVLDEYNTENDAYDAQKENLKTAKEKNSVISQQEALTRKIYDEQIAIAALQYGNNSKEVTKLQEELSTKLANYENDKFENIQTEYGNWLDMIQARIDGLDGSISIVEAKGITATQGLYKGKLQIEKENLTTLQSEKTALEEQHKATEVGTALWYNQEKELNSISTAIMNSKKNMIDYNKSIRDANDSVLELKKNLIELGNSYLDNFEKYLSRYELTDEDTGGLTKQGVAALGVYRKQYNSAIESQKVDLDKLNELKDIIDRYNIYDNTQRDILLDSVNYDSFEQIYEDYKKYSEAVQNDISTRMEAEDNIINLMKERYNAELSYIQELIINDRKQQLSDEKDLHDYQKSIQEKTDNISLLQKQLDALRNDGSEEAMQKRNSLQDQLDNAKEDLMDVEYDRYISDQQNMLDQLSEDYQNLIEDLLKDVDTLLAEGNAIADNNGKKFQDLIDAFTNNYNVEGFNTQQNDIKAIRENVEAEQKNQEAANEVLTAIENIGTMDYDGEGRRRLVDAENKYTSLTDAQKKIVNDDANGLALLQKKQQEWLALQTPEQPEQPASPSPAEMQNAVRTFVDSIKTSYNDWEVNDDKHASGAQKLVRDKILNNTFVKKNGHNARYLSATGMNRLFNWMVQKGYGSYGNDLYHRLKEIGFSHGGIVETLSKVPGMNGDDGWATLKRGEAVLTPEQTKMFQSMIKAMPPLTNALDYYKGKISKTSGNSSVSTGDINVTFELPNVVDSDSFIKVMQNDTRVRKVVQATVLDELTGKGSFNIKRF